MWGVKEKNKIGDFIFPLAAIRGDSNFDLPKKLIFYYKPSRIQRAVSTTIIKTTEITLQEQFIQQTGESGSTTR